MLRSVSLSIAIFRLLSCLTLTTFALAAPSDRIIGPITTTSTVTLGNGLRAHPWAKYDQGPIDPSFQLDDLALITVPSACQQKALMKLLEEQQDRASPNYRKWLTPQQYGERFGLSPNDVKTVTTWLLAQGFRNISVAPSSSIVMFSGTATQAEETFRTKIHRFQVEGRFQFSNVTPPQIPAALSGIVIGMRGLNNLHMKSMFRRRKYDYNDGSYLTGQLLAPADIATIYDIPSSMDGSGQTIAIIGRSDIFQDDLTDFRNGFGLGAIGGCTSDPTSGVIISCNSPYFKYVLVLHGGETDPLEPDSIALGDLIEADLDVEWAGSTAPKAQVTYVNAPAPNGNDVVEAMSYAIQYNVAPVVSLSFGLCEFGSAENAALGIVGFSESEFLQANSQGMTIINSSGDGGAAECDYEAGNNPAFYGYTVSYPASSPEITAVGGTLIPLISPDEYSTNSGYWSTTGTTGGSALKYIPEQVWNEAEEFGLYCSANPNSSLCTLYGITDWGSAQDAFGIDAGGGGVSNCATIDTNSGECLTGYPQPSYQSGLAVTLPNPTPETTSPARYVPDVSLLASPDFPGYIFCTAQFEVGGSSNSSSCDTSIADSLAVWGTVAGGTSFAAPVFAGMVALLNQSQSSNGLGNINTNLYALAANPSNGAFHPVITASTGAYSNGAFCIPGTPGSPQPSQLWCPAEGFLGYNAYNDDSTTSYNLVTGLGSLDLNLLASVWNASIASTTTAIQSSENPSYLGDPVTFTATVKTSGLDTPTGTVTFKDAGTQIGTGTLGCVCDGIVNSATATLTTSSLAVNTHSITAVYGGDSNNASSTSSALSQVVEQPDFSVTNTGATSATVLAGQSTTPVYSFAVAPLNGQTVFAAALTFSCSFSPTDSTLKNSSCIFNPVSIAAGSPASAGGDVTVSITTLGPNQNGDVRKHNRRHADNRLPWLPMSMTLSLAGIVLGSVARRKHSKYAFVGTLFLALLGAGWLVGCGAISSGGSTPPISVAVGGGTPPTLFPNDPGSLWPNQTANFSATVINDSQNMGVTWSASPGSIASTGAFTATYSAPNIIAGLPASATITATSVADTSKSGVSTETLNPATVPGTYTVTVTVSESSINHNLSPAPTIAVQ